MNEDQVKHMVERFLQWRLPENFAPDCGISFDKTYSLFGSDGPKKREPIGTNLFTFDQARAMVLHMLEGLDVHTLTTKDDPMLDRLRKIESNRKKGL